MKLSEPKSFSIFDEHDGSVWNVNPHFNDCGGNKKLNIVPGKTAHNIIFFFPFHSTM